MGEGLGVALLDEVWMCERVSGSRQDVECV